MKKLGMAIAIGALGFMAACGGGDKGKMKKMKDDMCACKDAKCVDDVNKKYADFMKSMEDKYKGGDKKPDEDMMKVGEEMAKCMSDAMTGGGAAGSDTGSGSASGSAAASGSGSASGSAAASGSGSASASDSGSGSAAASGGGGGDTGVPECDDYIKTMDKYMSCDKIPAQAKDASKQSIEAMKQSWAQLKDPNVPEATKKAAADGCKQAVDALKQSASAMGCAL